MIVSAFSKDAAQLVPGPNDANLYMLEPPWAYSHWLHKDNAMTRVPMKNLHTSLPHGSRTGFNPFSFSPGIHPIQSTERMGECCPGLPPACSLGWGTLCWPFTTPGINSDALAGGMAGQHCCTIGGLL